MTNDISKKEAVKPGIYLLIGLMTGAVITTIYLFI